MNKIRIGVLTSSRADYGIYKPLLDELKNNSQFELTLIAFGMHLQKQHGLTINEVKSHDYSKIIEVNGMPINDSIVDIAEGYGELIKNFAKFWSWIKTTKNCF